MQETSALKEDRNDHLRGLIVSTIKSIDYRLSTMEDVVHHNSDMENSTMRPTNPARPAARTAAPAKAAPAKKAAAPVDDFGDDFGFGEEATEDGFGEEAPAAGEDDGFGDFGEDAGSDFEGFGEDAEEAIEAPAVDDFDGFGEEAPADADDGFGDFGEEAAEPEAEPSFEEEAVEPEPEPLAPKLKKGVYGIPKGTPAFYVEGDDAGNWVKSIPVEEAKTKNLKAEYDPKMHNNAVAGLVDAEGRTFVVLGYKKQYYIVTIGEKLIDATTNKPAKLLKPKAAAPVKAAAPAKAQAAAPAKAAASSLTKAQVLAIKKFKAAAAELEAAFPEI